MARKRRNGAAPKRQKAVTVKLLEEQHGGKQTAAYRIMDELIDAHHSHLQDAKIAIAWRFGWKADPDGICRLGQAKKGSDLDRELHGYDFVILLHHEAWNKVLSEAQQKALMDHELCHCEVSKDSNGEPKVDERGRTVFRIRKHDIEEFREVVSRHGCYKADLEEFVAAARQEDRPLLQLQGASAG